MNITMSLTPDEVRAVLRYREEQRHEEYLVVTRENFYQSRCKCGWHGPEREMSDRGHVMAGRDGDHHIHGTMRAWDKDYALGRIEVPA